MAKDWSDMSEKMVARIAEVRESMEQTAKGDTLQTKQNCVLALREDPLFGGAIRLNLLTGQKVILKDLGWKRLAGPITDEDLSQIYYYLEKFYGLKSENGHLPKWELFPLSVP